MESAKHQFKKWVDRALTLNEEFVREYSGKVPGRPLTDDEKFVIAFASGQPLDYGNLEETEGGNFSIKIKLRNAVGVCWDGHKFTVFYKEK